MKRHRTASSQDEMLQIQDLNLIAQSLDMRKLKGMLIMIIAKLIGKMVTSAITPRTLKEIDRVPSFSDSLANMIKLTQIKHPSIPKSFSSIILINLISLTMSLTFWYIGLFKSFLCHLLFFLYISCEDISNNKYSFKIIFIYNIRYIIGLMLSYYNDNDIGRIFDHIIFLMILNNDFNYIKFNNLLIINTLCTFQYIILQLFIQFTSQSFLFIIISIIFASYLLIHDYIHINNIDQVTKLKQTAEKISNDYDSLKVYSNTQKTFINQLVPPHFSSSVRKQLIKKSLNTIQSEKNPLIIGISDNYENIAVIFSDIVGFTKYSTSHTPIEIVELLDRLFYFMDILCNKHGLYKVKTIGDAYMAVNGLKNDMSVYDICAKTADFALDVLHFVKDYKPMSDNNMMIRIGINIGPLVGGIIEMKRLVFDVFGDTVNLASRMESNGIPGSIQCSYSFYNILCNTYMFSYRGKVEMKGKGLTDCYLLESKLKSPSRTILRSFSSQSAKNMSVSSSSSSIDTPVDDNSKNIQETVIEYDNDEEYENE